VSLEVDLHDAVPLILVHREAHGISQDAGVVDQDVEPSTAVDGLGHERLGPCPARCVGRADLGATACCADLVDHVGRSVGVEVVDEHGCSFRRQEVRLFPPDAASGSRDDCDLFLERSHVASPSQRTPVRCGSIAPTVSC
jgi:hypothetical protein